MYHLDSSLREPILIQGGMGIGVSLWPLAKSVSQLGQLGVVSGTSADTLLIRQLQDGDDGGHIRRALSFFPNQDAVKKVLDTYFKPLGRQSHEPYRLLPLYRRILSKFQELVLAMGTFTQVYLAKEGHSGIVGLNLLTKIQMPTLPSLYGALLAGVDYVLMGAGIPNEIPGALKKLVNHSKASIRLDVQGIECGDSEIIFEPSNVTQNPQSILLMPKFIPIVSSHSLAMMLNRKCSDGIHGFIVEGFNAGGHNAPPRNGEKDQNNEPVYGERDIVDFSKIKELQKPFWIAGGSDNSVALKQAAILGASGVQVGTLFAFCKESGIAEWLKTKVIYKIISNTAKVFTDYSASPTGMPLKIFQLEDSMSDNEVYRTRKRKCDLGYLRSAYRKKDGSIDFKCPGEPINTYLKRGGDLKETYGKKCICNSLFSTAGKAQIQNHDFREPPLVTSSNQLLALKELITEYGTGYTAHDVIQYLLRN